MAHLDGVSPTISFSSGEKEQGRRSRWKGEAIPKGGCLAVATLVAGPACASPEPIPGSRPVQERVSSLANEEAIDSISIWGHVPLLGGIPWLR